MLNRVMLFPTFCLLSLMIGCGGEDVGTRPVQNTIAADGKLLVDDKPFGPAVLSFVHSTDKDSPGLEARVKADGTFDTLSYNGAADKPPEGNFRVVLNEDPQEMAAMGVPTVKMVTADIKAPAEGAKLPLEIKMTSQGGAMNMGGPDPNASLTQ